MDDIPPGTDLTQVAVAPGPYPDYKPKLNGKGELEDVTIAVCASIVALQLILLGIRLFTKLKSKSRLAFDDWCAIIAALLSVGLSACVIGQRDRGRHIYDFSLARAMDPTGAKLNYSSMMLVGPAIFMGKVTMLALYLKIFGHISKVKWSLYGVAFFALALVVMTPLDAVKCGRIPGQGWGLQNPACSETFVYGVVQGTFSLVIDLYIVILPIPIIMRLNLALKKRLGVLIIFLTGSIAIVCDIIVMKYRVDLYEVKDQSWVGFLILLLSVVETGISVMCSCMPTLAKFGRQHLFQWGPFITIRSFLSSRRSDDSSDKPSSFSPFGYHKDKTKKRLDPYSINMPTENSVTQLHSNAYIELNDHGHLAPSRDIQRTVEIEQISITEPEKSAIRMV